MLDAYHELIREERSKARGSIYDARATLAPEIAKTDVYPTSRYQRKKVETLFAHLKSNAF